jgi:hypothetical protein
MLIVVVMPSAPATAMNAKMAKGEPLKNGRDRHY